MHLGGQSLCLRTFVISFHSGDGTLHEPCSSAAQDPNMLFSLLDDGDAELTAVCCLK